MSRGRTGVQEGFDCMQNLFVAIALGAAAFSAPALAQAPSGGGLMQRDQTRAEAQQRTDTMFKMLDANQDGTLTRDEANKALTDFQATRGSESRGHGGRLQRLIDEAFGSSQSVTLKQFETQSLARFDAADLNHDGILTAAERQQARPRQPAAAPTTAAAPAKPQ